MTLSPRVKIAVTAMASSALLLAAGVTAAAEPPAILRPDLRPTSPMSHALPVLPTPTTATVTSTAAVNTGMVLVAVGDPADVFAVPASAVAKV